MLEGRPAKTLSERRALSLNHSCSRTLCDAAHRLVTTVVTPRPAGRGWPASWGPAPQQVGPWRSAQAASSVPQTQAPSPSYREGPNAKERCPLSDLRGCGGGGAQGWNNDQGPRRGSGVHTGGPALCSSMRSEVCAWADVVLSSGGHRGEGSLPSSGLLESAPGSLGDWAAESGRWEGEE